MGSSRASCAGASDDSDSVVAFGVSADVSCASFSDFVLSEYHRADNLCVGGANIGARRNEGCCRKGTQADDLAKELMILELRGINLCIVAVCGDEWSGETVSGSGKINF